jgi:hypothetical protein
MGMFNNILDNKQGKIILSIIWGLGLASLFRKACKGRKCIVIQAPNIKETTSNIYSFDNKCYKFVTESTSCK